MKTKLRLPSEERREAILRAARTLFSERGFHGTTTRELAAAAEVSEALLFKYFPTKEAIYNAMLSSCIKSPSGEEIRKLLALKPSTSTLILMVHHIFAKNIRTRGNGCEVSRLFIRSLSDDGSFAHVITRHFGSTWIAKLAECIDAAYKAGDADVRTENSNVTAWFCQHLALALAMVRMPEKQVISYGASEPEIIEYSVLFFLRGIGLKESAIKRHYDPAALTLLS